MAKRLGTLLSTDKTATIDEVIEFCENSDSKAKFFSNVVENQKLIEHNYKMMQLYAPQMSVQTKIHVSDSIKNFECEFNKTEIIGMMRKDGFGELNWTDLQAHLNKIQRVCLDRETK